MAGKLKFTGTQKDRHAIELARQCADLIWQSDVYGQSVGMVIEKVLPGNAVLAIEVSTQHLMSDGLCNNGIIYALAHSALNYACNSHNLKYAVQNGNMSYLTPALAGDRLTATAVEIHREGKSSLYDVMVTNQRRDKISELRGLCRELGGSWIATDENGVSNDN